ncbi:hypothetical protein [Aquimarina litoralis]|uniref:hypothetical protein n=1 Tax=Aquimarina litoralis TaxID=584605 RepID=UPI001C593B6D|nr:hypothetical protein [Aquimarina litoralis]MBW1298740.1 hypothetical protein [Aquimarina litoralis]
MKTLKLNILQKSIFLFCLSLFVISCSTDDSVENQLIQNDSIEKSTRQISALLSEDKDFISLTLEMEKYASFLENVISKSTLNVNELQNRLIALQEQGLEFNEEARELDKLLAYPVSTKTTEYSKNFSKKWSIILKKYGNVKQSDLEYSFAKVFEQNKSSFGSDYFGCNWRYYLCVGAAYAGAVICHAGCIGGTLGIGTPACVLFCGIGMTYAGVVCYDTYC